MKKLVPSLFCMALLTACASTNKGRAAQAVIVSDGAADTIAAGWQPFRHLMVDHCRKILPDTADEQDRINCLGIAAKEEELEALIQSLIAAQVAIKEAIKCEDLKSCPNEINWKELLAEIQKTWQALSPFLQAVKGMNQ